MSRPARSIETGLVYYVLDRGNERMHLFYENEDFTVFEGLLAEGLERYAAELLTYCLSQGEGDLFLREPF